MANGIDVEITEDGDLVIDNNDFVLISKDKLNAQIAHNIIKSVTVDWYYDHIGANMEELLGKECIEETAKESKIKILDALKKENFISEENIYVIYEVIEKEHIIAYNVYLKSLTNEPTTIITVVLDLVKGINVIS